MIRPATAADLETLLRLNNEAVPNVNGLTDEQMRWFLENVEFFRVAEHGGAVAGLLSALPAGSEYWSHYYRHICENFSEFLYIDRVFVDEKARGSRLGEKLYDALKTYAREAGYRRLFCEVNLEPPNPGSLRFHKRIGFEEAGTHSDPERTKIVQFLRHEISG